MRYFHIHPNSLEIFQLADPYALPLPLQCGDLPDEEDNMQSLLFSDCSSLEVRQLLLAPCARQTEK